MQIFLTPPLALSLSHAIPWLRYGTRHSISQDGSIDEAALRNLVAWQVESGIDFLVPCGTTGETPTLSHDEWLQVIDITVEVVAGRVPIVAGATSNSTQDAVEKAQRSCRAARASMRILTASPYYNKPTQEGQYRHFRAIAEAVDKPIILYNVPGPHRREHRARQRWRGWPKSRTSPGVKEASGNISADGRSLQRGAGNAFRFCRATTPSLCR